MRKRVAALLLIAAIVAVFLFLRSPSSPDSGAPAGSAGSAAPAALTGRPRPSSARPASAASGGDLDSRVESTGRTIFSAGWGSGQDQLGRDRPEEGNPLGPMSFAVDGRGRVHVLDEVNRRIVRRGADGKVEATIPIDTLEGHDIALSADGKAAVLDRYADKQVVLYDESGKAIGDYPLLGDGIDDVGVITGVFVDGDDVYVEREHSALVRIGDTSGQRAEPRSEIPGRPSRDGLSYLNAGIIDAGSGRVYVASIDRATDEHRFTRELRLKSYVQGIVLLDTDKAGIIYFGAQIEAGDEAQIVLTCMEPLKGVPIGGAVLPVNTLPEESFRDLVVLDEGGVVFAHRTESGVTYTQYDCE